MHAVKPYIISSEYKNRKAKRYCIVYFFGIALSLSIIFYSQIKNYSDDFLRKAITYGNNLFSKEKETKILFSTTVLGNNVNVRKEPSISADTIVRVSQGFNLGVLEIQGDWYKVQYFNQRKNKSEVGWIHKSLVTLPSQSVTESAKIDKPPMPYRDYGACPFECCTYRDWIAKEDIAILQDMREDSPVAFQVQKDEKVTAETGVVVTTKLGSAKIKKSVEDGNIHIAEGTIVYLLSYSGEGFWKVWYRDKIVSLQEGTDFEMINKPETIWWVKIRNNAGQSGWSNQPDNFGNKDACG